MRGSWVILWCHFNQSNLILKFVKGYLYCKCIVDKKVWYRKVGREGAGADSSAKHIIESGTVYNPKTVTVKQNNSLYK